MDRRPGLAAPRIHRPAGASRREGGSSPKLKIVSQSLLDWPLWATMSRRSSQPSVRDLRRNEGRDVWGR